MRGWVQHRYNTFLIYVLFSLIIFQSGTVQAAINSGTLFFKVSRLAMMLLALYYGCMGFFCLDHKSIFFFLALFLCLEVFALINFILYPDSWIELQYKIFLLLLLFLFIVWCKKKKVNFTLILYKVLVFIAYLTFVLYIGIEILHLPIPYTTMSNLGNTVYYKNYLNLFYSYSVAFPPRICGFFWEPGVNQIYLNLALLLFYLLDRDDKANLFILILSIALTQSSSGYIIMFIIMTAIIIRKSKIKSDYFLRITILVLGITCAFVAFLVKVRSTSGVWDSFSMRTDDLLTGLKLFSQHPILGTGFYNTSIFSEVSHYGVGNSNGLLTIMYTTGIIGLLFFIFPFLCILLMKSSSKEKRKTLTFFFYMIAINFTEPIYSLPIMMYLMAFAYEELAATQYSKNKLEIG